MTGQATPRAQDTYAHPGRGSEPSDLLRTDVRNPLVSWRWPRGWTFSGDASRGLGVGSLKMDTYCQGLGVSSLPLTCPKWLLLVLERGSGPLGADEGPAPLPVSGLIRRRV